MNGKANSRIINSQTMDLVEDDALVFDQFSNWLYIGKVNLPAEDSYGMRYVQIYVTAEKYGMVNLKNYLICHLFRKAQRGPIIPAMDIVKYVYSTTPSSSPLRKLFVELYLAYMRKNYWRSKDYSAELREVPDFAVDFAIALGNKYLGDSMEDSSHFKGNFADYYEEPASISEFRRLQSTNLSN